MTAIARIGTAGWTIPPAVRDAFPGEGTHLERYARVFDCVEVNSTFYRSHRASTYARWAASVPGDFRFALKLPKEITHVRRLVDCAEPLERFLDESASLGAKRDVLLVQLPGRFAFDAPLVHAFFTLVRERYGGRLACEPRNPSWFAPDADALLRAFSVARAGADPAVIPAAERPGGWDGFSYLRLHGSPRMYWDAYDAARLDAYAAALRAAPEPAWCIFDNTAHGAAAGDALALRARL